jgi:transcriptional regulator with XRE-family HTH domain
LFIVVRILYPICDNVNPFIALEIFMIGKRIKEYRVSTRHKTVEFSRLVGVSQGTLSDIENEKSKPAFDTIEAIIRNTDINPSWLFTGQGPMRIATAPTLIINADNVGQQIGTNSGGGDIIGFNLGNEKQPSAGSIEVKADEKLTPTPFSEEQEEVCELIRRYANITLLEEFRERLLKIKTAMGE